MVLDKDKFWCPLCLAEKDNPHLVIGSRDGLQAFRVCPSHVDDKHLPENNSNHADGTLRDVIMENGELVEL